MSREKPKPITFDLSAERARLARADAEAGPETPTGTTEPVAPSRAAKPVPKRGRASAPAPAERGAWLGRHAYLVAGVAALLWAGTLAAFVVGYEGRGGAFNYGPFRWMVAAALALLPAAFMLLFAYAVRQGARLAQEATRARALAADLTLPAGLAAAETTGLVNAVRAEIARAAEGAAEAGRWLTELREGLAQETQAVGDAALQAERSARTLAGRLQSERADLGALANQLGAQTQAVSDGVGRHTQLLAEAAEAAGAHAAEAERLLSLRAQELLAAAGEAGRAAESVGGELAHQTSRLHHLTSDLRDEREDFARTADAVITEEEALGARLEGRRARLLDAAQDAREGVDAISAESATAAERLNVLIQEAASALKVMSEEAQVHEAELDARARERVATFSGLVAEERTAIEGQTRGSLERVAHAAHAARAAAEEAAERMAAKVEAASQAAEQSVRGRMDDLGEAAFTAGQNVDQAFDVRIAAARRAIEASGVLVEEAGARSALRVEAGIAAMKDAVGGLQSLLTELDIKLSEAPQEAATRAAQVSAIMERGVDALVAAARRAAEETQTIDAAFNERLRRNAAAAAAAAAAAPLPPPAPVPPQAAVPTAGPAPAPAPRPPASMNGGMSALVTRRLNGANGHAPPAAAPEPPPPAPALRPRLRLTPTREDEAMRALFEPVAEPAASAPATPYDRPPPISVPAGADRGPDRGADRFDRTAERPTGRGDDGWSWKDLLTTLDDGVDDFDEEALAGRLIGEIESLGVDAEALLPTSRTDEIAYALGRGEPGAVRDSVRRLAPAAIRRLSRRVETDRVLREQADHYRAAFGGRLRDAARRGGPETARLLASEPGRAWLLLDAAAAERPEARA